MRVRDLQFHMSKNWIKNLDQSTDNENFQFI